MVYTSLLVRCPTVSGSGVSSGVMRLWVPGLVALAAALVLSCFDPLYEDLGQVRIWVVCCQQGQIDTCPCAAQAGCTPDLRACAGGRCAMSATATCSGTYDAGSSSDGGYSPPDGGPPTDAGTADGGATDGGSSQDGGHWPPEYELCCFAGVVTTCACPASGCQGQSFAACGGGTCVEQAPCP